MKNICRILAAIISIVTVLCLCACASSGMSGDNGQPAAGNGGAGKTASYVFTYKGTDIVLKEDAAPVIEKLGEPVSYFEAESCAFKGLDKSYTYPEIVIDTYPDGDTDRISSVRLTTDTVSTPEGVCLGDTLDKITSVYGSGYTNDVNSYVYTKGGVKLTFILTGDTVSSISYSME